MADSSYRPRLSMHRGAGRLVELARLLGRLPDGRQAKPSSNSKARQHVQDYSSPGSSVEVKPCRCDRPDDRSGRHAEPCFVDEIIGRPIPPRRAVRGPPAPSVGVVVAGDEVAEDDMWVRRPALPEVDLQYGEVPLTHVVLNRSKVHAETPDDATLGEELADRPPMTRQLRSIGGVRGEAAAGVHVAGVAAEDLFVGGVLPPLRTVKGQPGRLGS
jgi:hypothetical protein